MNIITHLVGVAQGKHPMSAKRSNHWPAVRKAHLALHPVCELCGGSVKLQVHHRMPFHLDQSLELDQNNLITLCESKKDGVNCHLLVGHLGSYKSYNEEVEKDSHSWNTKITTRP